MWFIQPKQDYIPEIPWKHDEMSQQSWHGKLERVITTPLRITWL